MGGFFLNTAQSEHQPAEPGLLGLSVPGEEGLPARIADDTHARTGMIR